MNHITINKIRTKKQLKKFIKLPREVYRKNPFWVPPMWNDERKAYKKRSNPILALSDFCLFLAEEDGTPKGRILAYVDHAFNSYYQCKIGFWGSFEAFDEPGVSQKLFTAAEEWLLSRGMDYARGPINPIAENWGFLQSGFDSPPLFLTPYNPSYYNEAAQKSGYTKVKDLLAFLADYSLNYSIPDRFEHYAASFLEREPDFTVRYFNLNNLKGEAEIIWHLTNESLKDNWGYVPVDRNVMNTTIKQLKYIMDPKAIWFVEYKGKAVGYCLGYPDLNRIIVKHKGNMFPFGYLDILLHLKKTRYYRLFSLAVHPDFHGKGLDVLMYIHLHRALEKKNISMEANYILEDNFKIKNALIKLGMAQTKVYRIYEKKII